MALDPNDPGTLNLCDMLGMEPTRPAPQIAETGDLADEQPDPDLWPYLPASLQTLVRLVGLSVAMKLALHYGGGRLPRIPTARVGKNNEMAELIGDAAMGQLIARGHELEDERPYIPQANKALIYWLTKQGYSRADIVKELRVSRSAVYQFLANLRAAR